MQVFFILIKQMELLSLKISKNAKSEPTTL